MICGPGVQNFHSKDLKRKFLEHVYAIFPIALPNLHSPYISKTSINVISIYVKLQSSPQYILINVSMVHLFSSAYKSIHVFLYTFKECIHNIREQLAYARKMCTLYSNRSKISSWYRLFKLTIAVLETLTMHTSERERTDQFENYGKEKREFPSEDINKEINETILALRDCSYAFL